MADDFLPPLIAVVGSDIAGYTAGLTEAQARMDAFVASQRVALAELDAAGAAAGAGATGAGVAAGAETEATAAAAAVTAANDEMAASSARAAETMGASDEAIMAGFAKLGASADRMAEQHYVAIEGMKARQMALATSMADAEAKAAASNVALGDAMAGTAARTEAQASVMGGAKTALLAVGAAAVLAGVETAKMAGDFNMATERLVTSAGESQRNLDMVRQGILGMAGAVGYSTTELAKAMYTVESGGQHGAAGLKTLQAAAEGAKTENADLATVADAVTSVLQDYHLKADDAATVTSKLVAATSQGKTTFEELAGSMSAVLPVASANHISLNDILGDLASMTVHGMSAEQAAQNLANAIRAMSGGNSVAAKEFAVLGMNATEVSKTLGEKGLSGTVNEISNRIRSQMGPDGLVVLNLTNALKGMSPPVQELGQKVLAGSMSMKDFTKAAKDMGVINDKQVTSFAALAGSMHGVGTEAKSGTEVYQSYSQALQKAMGGATGLNVALMLTGENSKTTANAIQVVSGATAQADGHVKGWDEIQGQFNQKLAEAKDGLGALAITIGEKLLPVLTPLVGALADGAKWLAEHQTAATILAGIIGGLMVGAIVAVTVAFWAWAAAAWATLVPLLGIDLALLPFIAVAALVAAAVALLVYGAYELITHWDQVKHFFSGLWDDIESAFTKGGEAVKHAWDDFWVGLGEKVHHGVDDIGHWFADVGRKIAKPFEDGFEAVKRFFDQSPQQMGEEIGRLVGRIVRDLYDGAKRAWHSFTQGLEDAWTDTVNWFKALPGRFKNFLAGANQWVGNEAREIWHGAQHGIEQAWHDTVQWFKDLPHRFKQFLQGANTWIGNEASDIWHGAEHGIESAWNDTVQWFKDLPHKIKDFFKAAPGWLWQAGQDIMSGLWKGVTDFFGNIWKGITGFIHGFIHGFEQGLGVASPSTIFARIGGDVMRGFLNGLENMAGAVWGYLQGIPSRIIHFFAGAPSWLVAAGYNILVGLYNGMIEMWNKITSFVGGIGSWIASHKGPIEADAVLLTPHGNAIMGGLLTGLQQGGRQVQSYLDRFTTGIGGGGINGTIGVSGSALAGSLFGGAGGQVVNLQVTVQGHVWTTKDLVTEIQTQLLRHNIRNVSNGTSWSFG